MSFTIANAMPRKQYGTTSYGERLPSIRKALGFNQVQPAEAAGTIQRAPKVERMEEDSEARRMWKRFQLVSELPERDQKAVIRQIIAMAGDTLEAKAHELLGQLNQGKLPAVVHLLEVMVHEEELAEEDRRAIAASREYFRQGGQGLSLEQVAAECGFIMDQIRGTQKTS